MAPPLSLIVDAVRVIVVALAPEAIAALAAALGPLYLGGTWTGTRLFARA